MAVNFQNIGNMKNNNEKYLSSKEKEALVDMRVDLRIVKEMLKSGEKKFEDCNQNIKEIIKSSAEDKESIRQWSEDKFVSKKCFEPIKKTYNSLAAAGIGVLVLIGTVGLGVFMFFKNHFIK